MVGGAAQLHVMFIQGRWLWHRTEGQFVTVSGAAIVLPYAADGVRHGKDYLMRLWSIHPKYLDSKGLVALWREGLLALAVLQGKTKGYTHHPQLVRFRKTVKPIDTMTAYLSHVFDESVRRGYHFDPKKIKHAKTSEGLNVTRGQLLYELEHLRKKLNPVVALGRGFNGAVNKKVAS